MSFVVVFPLVAVISFKPSYNVRGKYYIIINIFFVLMTKLMLRDIEKLRELHYRILIYSSRLISNINYFQSLS